MMPWWALAVLIFGANFAIWGFIGLCRQMAALIRKVHSARAARRAARQAGPQAPPHPAGSAMPHTRGPGAWGLPTLPPALAGAQSALAHAWRALAHAWRALAHAWRALAHAWRALAHPWRALAHAWRALAHAWPALAEAPSAQAPPAVWRGLSAPPSAGPSADNGNLVRMRGTGQLPGNTESLTVQDVAVLIAAHNEALVIGQSLEAIMELVPHANVHVVSDGSTDRTLDVARRTGANVIETQENLGKAGALHEAIQRFGLLDRFRAVMLLDADTRVLPGYFDAALPMFDGPEVVAVAGCVKTDYDRELTPVGNLLIGHRERIYVIGQRVLKYGQTSRHFNATPIVPGFASIYRSEVLPRIDMNPPGLAIEDFNMTFEVYQKQLGKVGFTLGAVAVTQDPDNLHDYIRQTKRWALGLWQTVRRHPPRTNLFTAMVALLLFEMVTSSLMFLLLPMLLVVFAVPELVGGAQFWPWFAPVYTAAAAHIKLSTVFFGIVVPDYALTVVVAVLDRRPRLLVCGFFFPVLRMVDAAIGIYAIPMAWLSRSNGRWKSPTRSITVSGQRAVGGVRAVGAEMPALSAVRLAGTADMARPNGAGAARAAFMGEVRHASG